MLKSMTAFGRACITVPIGRFTVEIQSVNRKHLEINTLLPKELVRFDSEIKQWISTQVFRGQIIVKVTVCFEKDSPTSVSPNLPLARQIKSAWNAIAEDLGLDPDKSFSLSLLSAESGVLLFDQDLKDEAVYRQGLKEGVEEALKYLVAMKLREGNTLKGDIAARLVRLEKSINLIAEKAPEAPKKYRQKLIERLEEVLKGCVENEDRILREVCVFAEKVDISEEITRFNSHLKQFESLLEGQFGGVGKTMEFLIQELNREANTIGSKSSDVEIVHQVVDIKAELERIREQIQNIE